MLKEQAKIFTGIAKIADVLAVTGAFTLAYYGLKDEGGLLSELNDYVWVLWFVIPTWYLLLTRYGLHQSLRAYSIPQVISSLLKVHAVGGIVVAAAIYLIAPHGYSRNLFMAFIVLSCGMMSLEKILLKTILGFMRRKGFNYRNILIVGTEEKAQSFIAVAEKHVSWGLRIIGVLLPQDEPMLEKVGGTAVLGRLDGLVDTCKKKTVDEVVFCLPKSSTINIDDHIRDMEEMGITVRMVLDLYDVHRSRRELSFFHDELPILTFYYKSFDAGQLLLKRCLDIAGAGVGLCITALLLPFIAVAIKLESKGPLIFGQFRVGENGRLFKCWKFRSMYQDAEERKKELAHLNEMSGAIFKIKDDPRITRVGKFMRKTSLDELPQFWNVFKGEMSLVGTRPPTPDEVASYENWHRRRISIKPGITGLWQVSGRNEIQDFDEIVRLDLRYIDNWSPLFDIKILLQTLLVVFMRKGSS